MMRIPQTMLLLSSVIAPSQAWLLWGMNGACMVAGLEVFAFFLATLVVRALRGSQS